MRAKNVIGDYLLYTSMNKKTRRDQWKVLSNCIEKESDLCLLIVDFNDVLCNDEKEGEIIDQWLT